MTYVNNEGPITTINSCPQAGASREVSDDDPEVIAFMKRADDAANGVRPISEHIENQICSPLAQALFKLGVISEEKTRACLQEYFKTGTDTQQTPQK